MGCSNSSVPLSQPQIQKRTTSSLQVYRSHTIFIPGGCSVPLPKKNRTSEDLPSPAHARIKTENKRPREPQSANSAIRSNRLVSSIVNPKKPSQASTNQFDLRQNSCYPKLKMDVSPRYPFSNKERNMNTMTKMASRIEPFTPEPTRNRLNKKSFNIKEEDLNPPIRKKTSTIVYVNNYSKLPSLNIKEQGQREEKDMNDTKKKVESSPANLSKLEMVSPQKSSLRLRRRLGSELNILDKIRSQEDRNNNLSLSKIISPLNELHETANLKSPQCERSKKEFSPQFDGNASVEVQVCNMSEIFMPSYPLIEENPIDEVEEKREPSIEMHLDTNQNQGIVCDDNENKIEDVKMMRTFKSVEKKKKSSSLECRSATLMKKPLHRNSKKIVMALCEVLEY